MMKLASSVFAALAALLAAAEAAAFVGDDLAEVHGVPVGIKVVRPALTESATEAFGSAMTLVDRESGEVRLITGPNLAPAVDIKGARGVVQGELERTAMDFLAEHRGTLGVEPGDVKLIAEATLIDLDVQFLKYAVSRDGILIEDANVDFRFKKGHLVQVQNTSYAEAELDEAEFSETVAKRLSQVAKATLLASDATKLGEILRVEPRKGGYALKRILRFDVKGVTDRFLVDVGHAGVHEIRPTTFKLDGNAQGQIFPRWYNEAPDTRAYGELTLVDPSGDVTTALDGTFGGAADAAQPKLDGFTGTRVKIALSSGTKVVVAGSRIRDRWNVTYTRGGDPVAEDKNMAQSMVFYHANAMIQRAKSYVSAAWLDRQLTANVNLTQTCNAHWDGSTINLYSAGGGCANTGLISDVVYHEWGHGFDANTGGIGDGAFSEGYGDTMSMIMTQSNVLGIGFRTDGSPVRDLEPDRVYPRDARGGVHAEGLIIGSTFWDTYKALLAQYGRDAAVDMMSKFAIKVIFTATRYTDVYNALLVIDDNDANPSNGTPNYCLLNKTFAAHGLATADAGCNLAAVEEVRVDDSAGGNGNGVIEPGEHVSLWVTARNAANDPINELSARLSIPSATGVTVTDDLLSWDAVPARDVRRSRDAAEIDVTSSVACGTPLNTVIDFVSGDRTAQVELALSVGRLAGEAAVFAATGLPLAIVDNQTTTATLEVGGAQWSADTAVHAAHLKFDVTHTYAGDLTVSLVAPDGTRKEIIRGSGADDNIHFDADVTEHVKGLKGLGAWKLEVADNAAQDVGTLDSAQLTLTPAFFECQ